MRGQIERNRKPALSRCQVAPVKQVRLFSGRKSCGLWDSPRMHHVQRAVGPAQKRRNSRSVLKVFEPLEIRLRVETLHSNLYRIWPLVAFRSFGPSRGGLVIDL